MPGVAVRPWRRVRPRVVPAIGSTVLPVPAPPATPSSPSPADGTETRYTLLSWVAAGATKFDIYLDTVTPPVALAVPKYVGTSYVPTLLPSTTYYWQIVAFNDGGSAAGPVWSFTTPSATKPFITVAGSLVSHVRAGSILIHDVLGATANTGSATFDTTAPVAGQSIQIGLGSLDDADLIFAGEFQLEQATYVDHPDSGLWPVSLIDHVFTLNKRRPFGTWVDVSATTIVQYLIATFAPRFSTTAVEADLPAISITFDGSEDFSSALQRIAVAVGGYFKVGYDKTIHLRVRADTEDVPDPVDASHPPLNDPTPSMFTTDFSQLRTRVYGKGNGQTVPGDLAVGETILPLVDVSMFNPAGGQAIAGTTPEGAQSEILTYRGVQLPGGGSLVGPGAAPSTAPVLALKLGTGLGTGWYGYAVVNHTAAGPSLPGPIGTILTNGAAAASNPAAIGGVGTTWNTDTNGLNIGPPDWTYKWAFTFRRIADGAETALSPVLTVGPAGAVTNFAWGLDLAGCTSPPSGYVRQWYRTVRDGATFMRIPVGTALSFAPTFVSGTEVGGFFIDHTVDGALGATAPSSNGSGPQLQVTMTGIAIGASPTTSRDVYRTAVQSTQAAAATAQLKLLTSIADNTTTIYTDVTADGSLGANAPTGDTSGLAQPSGQVNAGSTSILTASASPFSATGGWVMLGGGQVVRYTGISSNTLTGVPTSGPGALLTTVLYGSQALPAPALTGINAYNGLGKAIAKGSTVAIWVQRDDLDAQAALGQLELDKDGNATDGIHEFTIIDGRRNENSLIALCDADLAQFANPIVSVTYQTRDTKSRSGKTVYVNLPSVGPVGSYVIQSVDISFDGPARPRYLVKASSVTFSLDDLWRRVALTP